MTIRLGASPLTIEDVVRVARVLVPVEIADQATARIAAARRAVEEHLASGATIYGLTTGFGALADVRVERGGLEALQHNLVRSHAAGAGGLLDAEVVRAMLLTRAGAFCAGHSGVRPAVVERLLTYLNQGLHPAVPARGSVGASGDLAQLAHVALTLTGEGRFLADGGATRPAAEVLAERGIEPLRLHPREGLALINGTDGMLALGALAAHDAARLLRAADVACAMTVEAALGTDRPFAADIQALRPHPGQVAAAANLRRLLAGSEIVASHRDSPHAVQDPYSLRCAPQVHGAARDTLATARQVLERELAAVVDNPVLLPDGRIESTGNFHGQPLAHALDFLAIALSGLAGIAERRTHFLLSVGEQRQLPAFLAADPGLECGYMVAQYTQASLVAETRLLAAPASVQSIPTSGIQEDHVSMGWLAGLKLREAVGAVATVVAVELLCAARGLDLRAPLRAGEGTAAAWRHLRSLVPAVEGDHELAPEIAAVARATADGSLLGAVEEAIGPLD